MAAASVGGVTQPSAQLPPGWYDDGAGATRWWDGNQWTQHAQLSVPTQEDRTMGMLSQLLGIFVAIIGPLIIYLIKKDESPFVRHHSSEALNFNLTMFIGILISFPLMLVVIGFVTFFAIVIGGLIFQVIATIAANNGEWYRFPINIRMVPGAAPQED
jgi:uncharacterized Tic20 family protein